MTMIDLLRSNNLSRSNKGFVRILELIWHGLADNRRDLRLALEMSKASMTRKIEQALQLGLLEEGDTISDGVGRNPVSLRIPAGAYYLIGVNFSCHEANHIAITDAQHNVVAEAKVFDPGPIPPAEKLDMLGDKIDELLAECNIPVAKVLAIGTTLSGVFDPTNGDVRWSSAFYRYTPFNLFELFKQRYQCPVTMINRSHLLAVAEKRWGDAKALDHFIYLDCAGLGAGIYTNGRLYRGHQFQAGEIGFQQIEQQSDIGPDGRPGLLNQLAGGFHVIDALEQIITNNGFTLAAKYVSAGKPVNLEIAAKAAADGDALCQQLLAKNFDYIARSVVNVAYEFNPQAIFLSNWTAWCPGCSIDIVKRHMAHYGASKWQLSADVLSARTGIANLARAATLVPLSAMFQAHAPLRPNL